MRFHHPIPMVLAVQLVAEGQTKQVRLVLTEGEVEQILEVDLPVEVYRPSRPNRYRRLAAFHPA